MRLVALWLMAAEATEPVEVVSEADAQSFGQTLETFDQGDCDLDRAKVMLHTDSMMPDLSDGDVPKGFMKGFMKGYRDRMSRLVCDLSQEGEVQLLNAGPGQVTMRVLLEEGVTYHRYSLRYVDGEVRADSVYGTALGTTIRGVTEEMMGVVLQAPDPIELLQLMSLTNTAASMAQQAGRAKLAFKVRDGFPGPLRDTRMMIAGRLTAASALKPRHYLRALEEAHARLPDDPLWTHWAIDLHTLREDAAAALSAIDRLDDSVGGDPFLDVVRGDVLLTVREDVAGAMGSYRRAIAREPSLGKAHERVIWAQLVMQDHGGLANSLSDALESAPQAVDLAEVRTGKEYRRFRRSADGVAWLQRSP